MKALHLLGEIYITKADYNEALDVLTAGLDISRSIFDQDSLDAAAYYRTLGKCYVETGYYTKATQYLEHCYSILAKDSSHMNYTNNMISYYCILGKIYEYQLLLDFSQESYNKAKDLALTIFSSEHPELFPIYCGLGNVCFGMLDFSKAFDYYMKAFDIAQKRFPPQHLTFSICYYSFGNIYLRRNLFEIAQEYYKHALTIKEKYFPSSSHPDIAKVKFNLSNTFLKKENFQQAMLYLQEAEEIFVEKFSKDHVLIAGCLNNKGKIFEAEGKLELALDSFKKALKKYKMIFGENHIEVGECYLSIGQVLYSKREYGKAISYYSKVLRIEEAYEERKAEVGDILYNMGLCFARMKGFGEAEKMFLKARRVYMANNQEENGELQRKLEILSSESLKRKRSDI